MKFLAVVDIPYHSTNFMNFATTVQVKDSQTVKHVVDKTGCTAANILHKNISDSIKFKNEKLYISQIFQTQFKSKIT